jgi:hypothetical protein
MNASETARTFAHIRMNVDPKITGGKHGLYPNKYPLR